MFTISKICNFFRTLQQAPVEVKCPEGTMKSTDGSCVRICPDGEPATIDENGIEKCPLTNCDAPMDMIFLIDGSDSIRKDEWPVVGDWVKTLVDRIRPLERKKDTKVVYQQYSSQEDFPAPLIYTISSESNPDYADDELDLLNNAIDQQEQKAKERVYFLFGQCVCKC